MERVYSFTNENVFSYQFLYDFSNANVLSVLGSGDQYFSSLLYGANCIDVYDINPLAWDYFVLKYYGLMTLSYEEFYEYFVEKELNDLNYFHKLVDYLPRKARNKWETLYHKYTDLSVIITPDSGRNLSSHVIPYFDQEKYYQLQSILRNRKLPTFYLENFLNLPNKLKNKHYDIVLASNIFYSIYFQDEIEKVSEFKELLKGFNCPNIQALYYWGTDDDMCHEFEKNGFEINSVRPVSRLYDDSVISLRRKL